MDQPLRVLFLSQGADVPSTRFRITQFLPYLAQHGVEAHVSHCSPGFYQIPADAPSRLACHQLNARKLVSRVRALLTASSYDVVVIQRELIPYDSALLEQLAKRFARKVVLDFDDAIFLNYKVPWEPRNKIARIASLSDEVWAGNSFLAQFASTYNPHVHVVPTSVDLGKYQYIPRVRSNQFVIGWTGTSSNFKYLAHAAPALSDLASTHQNVIVRLMCDKPPNGLPPMPFPCEFVPWSEEREIDVIRSFDCGLMPLDDDDWCRGKCSLKVLLYFALGVPAVASAVGNNIDVIENGISGLLIHEDAAWHTALSSLIRDPTLGQRLASTAHDRVREKYSTSVCAEQIALQLRKLATHTI